MFQLEILNFKYSKTIFQANVYYVFNNLRITVKQPIYPLFIIKGKPTIYNDQSRLQFSSEVGKITYVSLHGFAYPSPSFSWMSSSGGKLGTWTIAYANGEFRTTSTILPTRRSHINDYKALIQNTVGSLQILINLHVYGNI